MQDPRYGGAGPPAGRAGRFASTGGWTLGKGDPMSHYSKHPFITLTIEEQAQVERVSKNIYRPCCNNATFFPDCNHGMAMLGLLELMASQGASDADMYSAALTMNRFWFPEQYALIERYFEMQGVDFLSVDPQEILGEAYSSGSGLSRIAALVPPVESGKRGGGCSV
jgi:hypothetical protein